MGYFSGSPSHINDFKVIAPEIKYLLDKYKTLKLLIVGFLKLPPYLEKFKNNGQIIIHKLVDFVELEGLISSVDINLIPLVQNEFTNSKSELKFFEAGLVKTVSIATPTFVYKSIIADKYNGFLAQQGEWSEIIEGILNKKYDINSIAEQAYKYSIENYYVKKISGRINDVYVDILKNK